MSVLPLRPFVHGGSILRNYSRPTGVGQGGCHAVLTKAQEIHDYIVSTGKADYWMGVAKLLADRRGQHRPGKPYSRSIHALRHELKAELSDAVNDANDHHWEEIAHWLVYEAGLS